MAYQFGLNVLILIQGQLVDGEEILLSPRMKLSTLAF